MKYELERELNQRGYQNIVVREMTDALLRTVVEESLVEEVAERFEQARSARSESSK
jgi:broad-specificity NMP kinase